MSKSSGRFVGCISRHSNMIFKWVSNLRTSESFLIPQALLCVATASIFVSIYFVTYQIFFLQLPIEDIMERKLAKPHTSVTWAWPTEELVYPGYAYFDGVRLTPKGDSKKEKPSSITGRYFLPAAVNWARAKELEVFIKAEFDAAPSREVRRDVGVLRVTQVDQNGLKTRNDIHLSSGTYQRHRIPLLGTALSESPSGGSLSPNTIEFEILPDEGGANAVVFSTNLSVGLAWPAVLFMTIALALAALAIFLQPRVFHPGYFAAATLAFLLSLVFHGGALTSNMYFTKLASQSLSPFIAVDSILRIGDFPSGFYHSPLVALVGFATWWIDGSAAVQDFLLLFNSTFPTARYVMFVWFLSSLLYLLWVIYKYYGTAFACLFAVMSSVFLPFIIDLYALSPDVYLVPLFVVFFAVLLVAINVERLSYLAISVLAGTFFVMLSYKITAMILLVIVPTGLALGRKMKWNRIPLAQILILTGLMVAAVPLSKAVKYVAYDGPRIAVPEENIKFANSHLWEVIWAAYGDYDEYSAHSFVKDGVTRDRRVREKTGIWTGNIRHSRIAEEKVYKPEVIQAMLTVPNFFYSTAFVRLYEHGIAFWRYPRGGGRVWRRWGRGDADIDAIRRNKYWKIAPLVFVSKIVQYDIRRAGDILLIALALLGAVLLPRRDLAAIIVALILAKYAAMGGVHVLVRYFNFVNVAMLFSFCFALLIHGQLLSRIVRERWEAGG